MDQTELPPHERVNGSRRRRALIRWVLGLSLIAIVLWLVWADPEPLLRLRTIQAEVLAGFALLVALNQLLMSRRLALAVEQCGGHGASAFTWFRLTSVAQFLNLFVPQLGNVYRAVVLKRDHGIAYMVYASGLFAFVWLDLVMGFGIALLVVLTLEPELRLAGVSAPALLGGTTVLLGLAPLLLARGFKALPLGSGLVARLQLGATSLLGAAGSAMANPRFLLRFFAINLLVTVTHVATLWLAFQAVGAAPAVGILVMFQVFVKLANQVAITPGNLGLTELAYGVLASATDSSLEQGLAVGLLLRAVGTLAVVVLGLMFGGAGQLLGARRRLEPARDQPELAGGAADVPAELSATKK
jgi:uncharacterized membrane protein YbhN (UPF0104 family)